MIKAVIFDIDGVLIDSFDANLKFFQDLMVDAGYNPPTRETYEVLFHVTMKQAIKIFTDSAPDDEVLRIWKMGKEKIIDSYPNELLKIPEGMEEVLNTLSKRYALAIVSSRTEEGVAAVSQITKLRKLFKTIISYNDTQNHKPHPEPLLLAASGLGFNPSECVYVGDTMHDVKAAKAAGMKAIAYSKSKIEGADATTYKFKELPNLIMNLI